MFQVAGQFAPLIFRQGGTASAPTTGTAKPRLKFQVFDPFGAMAFYSVGADTSTAATTGGDAGKKKVQRQILRLNKQILEQEAAPTKEAVIPKKSPQKPQVQVFDGDDEEEILLLALYD